MSFFPLTIQPSNIFFSLDGSVKVGDFGLVTAHTSENNMDTPIKGMLRKYYLSWFLTFLVPIFNQCYKKELLTQLCCSNSQQWYVTKQCLMQHTKFGRQFRARFSMLHKTTFDTSTRSHVRKHLLPKWSVFKAKSELIRYSSSTRSYM